MLWDDFSTAHALVCRALALFAAAAADDVGANTRVPPLTALAAEDDERAGVPPPHPDADWWGGCEAGVVPPVALALIDGFHAIQHGEWLATTCEELHFEWPPVPPAGVTASGGVAVLPFVVAGSQGACTHVKYCSNELAAAPLLHYKRHMAATFRLPSALPPSRAPRTVVLVQRAGRRKVTNMEEVAALVRSWGFEARIVGPFAGWPIEAQMAAFANASGAVFAMGAELGPALLGLPRGACAVVCSPAGAQDGFAYYVGDKVGIKIANIVDSFTVPGDPRIGKKFVENYQADLAVTKEQLRGVAWCLNQAPAGTRGAGHGNTHGADYGIPW
jgi:hypothetical protein